MSVSLSSNRSEKKHRKNLKYDCFLVWHKKDFEKKNWQKKNTRDGFTWYDHNCIRKMQICNYSKFADKCGGKMKVPEKADKAGLYRIEFTEDGYAHFLSENKELSIDLEVPNFDLPNLNSNAQTQSELEKKKWDELSKELMEKVQISPHQQILNSQYHPPEIISVSEDNDRIDWEKIRANSNLKMVIARSSIGLKLDKEFYYNSQSMISVGFQQIGVYHHFLGGSNSPTAEKQLQFVTERLEKVGFKKEKNLFAIAVQTEHNADADPKYFTAQLARFISLLLQNDFMRPIIYCNNNSWKKLIDPSVADELFSKLPLWIARFTDDPKPEYPDTWKSRGIQWWMWQYSELGVVDGIINHVNCSRRNELYSIQDDLFCSAV